MYKKLIFSGVQPTGEIHIGNYLGAISQFVANQDKYDSIYSIVDLHAITVWQDPKTIQSQIHHVLSVFIAAGLDYEKNMHKLPSEFHPDRMGKVSTIKDLEEIFTPFNYSIGG